jgi:hypothetical protein
VRTKAATVLRQRLPCPQAARNHNVASYDCAGTASGKRKWLNISIIIAHVKHGPSPLSVH